MKSADLNKPENIILEFENELKIDKLKSLIKELSTYSHRIKGFVYFVNIKKKTTLKSKKSLQGREWDKNEKNIYFFKMNKLIFLLEKRTNAYKNKKERADYLNFKE